MRLSSRVGLVAVMLPAMMLLAACGDDNGEPGSDGPAGDAAATTAAASGMGDEGEATQPVEDATVTGDDDDNGPADSGEQAFDGIPVPANADETASGSWSGAIPGAVPGTDFDAESFETRFKTYEVDASPSQVVGFYLDRMDDWDKELDFFVEDEGGTVLWTRDGGQEAVWIAAAQANGSTELTIISGTRR